MISDCKKFKAVKWEQDGCHVFDELKSYMQSALLLTFFSTQTCMFAGDQFQLLCHHCPLTTGF